MNKYYVNNKEVNEQAFIELFEEACEEEAQDTYDDMIDDITPMVVIGSLSYIPSHALKTIDPIAYHCGLSDYENCMLIDRGYELDTTNKTTVNGVSFKIMEEEEDV